jgi:hypothetical protein
MPENVKTPENKVNSSWSKRVLAASLVVVSCGIAYWFGPNFFSGPLANGGLFVEDRHLNFGKVWADQQFSWKLPIVNRASQEVDVVGFATSCSCSVSVNPDSFSLKPGEVQVAELTLDLRRQNQKTGEAWERNFQTRIVPQLKGNLVHQQGWTIHGNVRDALQGVPGEIDLGDQNYESPSPGRAFVIQWHPEVEKVESKCDASWVKVEQWPTSKGKNHRKLNVRLAGELRPGSFQMPVFLTPITHSGKRLPPSSFFLWGNVLHDVTVSQSDFTLGILRLGEKCTENVTFRSRSGKPFALDHDVSNRESITVLEKDSPSLNIRCFQLLIRATKKGPQKERVRFSVKDFKDQNPVQFTIGVNYHGIP